MKFIKINEETIINLSHVYAIEFIKQDGCRGIEFNMLNGAKFIEFFTDDEKYKEIRFFIESIKIMK